MVDSRSRKNFFFAVFLLPCVVLYSIFFVYPFLNGLYISLTNWDGLTPRSPITMDASEFEKRILNRLDRPADRAYLLSVYAKNETGNTYDRLSMGGWQRHRVESLIAKTGYQPDRNRFVGLKNYADILAGKVGESFYPRAFSQSYYTVTSALPQQIDKKDFTKNFLSRLTSAERSEFDSVYLDSGAMYTLNPDSTEFGFEDMIWLIPEVDVDATIDPALVDGLVVQIREISLTGDRSGLESAVSAFGADNRLSAASIASVREGAAGIFSFGAVKSLMAAKWTSRGFDLGVVGFTLFFAFFSVIGINLLAFLLALALDTGLKGQSFLRSVFFLPNVLSMIIVALIWKMLFFQMFPKLTGIEQWLSDPGKTPWLIVLVAVWQGAGYYMIVYLAGLQNIPPDVLEAATIDGAGPWQRFKNITLPLLLPAITISLFLTIANALKSFDLIYAMTSGSAYTYGTVPVVLDIFMDAFARKQAGLATAKAMLLFAFIFAITGAQLYIMKKKEIEQ